VKAIAAEKLSSMIHNATGTPYNVVVVEEEVV
jgi:hypothetical protein